MSFSIDQVKVKPCYTPVAIINTRNGCCPEKPVILAENIVKDSDGKQRINYSCQCACDGWCTNGHRSAPEAIAEYREMTDRYVRYLTDHKYYEEVARLKQHFDKTKDQQMELLSDLQTELTETM